MTKEEAFIKYKEIYNYANIGIELEDVVDINKLILCPCANTIDTGLAFEGALMFHTIMVWHFANKLLPLYNKIGVINAQSLAKVIVLHQIGKIDMFTPNSNEWEIDKLGKAYVFAQSEVCLKVGERSKLISSNSGIKFSLEEYEAMGILDKSAEEYENMSRYRTHLSTLLKMSNDMAYTVARERFKMSNKK